MELLLILAIFLVEILVMLSTVLDWACHQIDGTTVFGMGWEYCSVEAFYWNASDNIVGLRQYHKNNILYDEYLVNEGIEIAATHTNSIETIDNMERDALQLYLAKYKNIKLSAIQSGMIICQIHFLKHLLIEKQL